MSILQGVRGCKVSQQSKHPPFSLQRVLEPIMCGNSLWMCPAVQDSVPSGPHLKEGRDLQAEDWKPQHWASHICIIKDSDEAEKKTPHNNKTYSINKWNIHFVWWCVRVYVYTCINHVGTKICSHCHIFGDSPLQKVAAYKEKKTLHFTVTTWFLVKERIGHVVVG